MHIRPASNADEENGNHETVDSNDPNTNHQVGFQIRHHLRKPDYDNAGVEGCHENSDGCDRQDNPLVIQENPTHNKYFSTRPKNPEYKLRPRTRTRPVQRTIVSARTVTKLKRRYLFTLIVS